MANGSVGRALRAEQYTQLESGLWLVSIYHDRGGSLLRPVNPHQLLLTTYVVQGGTARMATQQSAPDLDALHQLAIQSDSMRSYRAMDMGSLSATEIIDALIGWAIIERVRWLGQQARISAERAGVIA